MGAWYGDGIGGPPLAILRQVPTEIMYLVFDSNEAAMRLMDKAKSVQASLRGLPVRCIWLGKARECVEQVQSLP